METTYDSKLIKAPAAWGAVFSMALCVAVLIASEFMPVSLLTPIAADLAISEGQTGQAISISGVFAVLTSLLTAGLTRRMDRRFVTIGFAALLIVSGTIVTLAPNYAVLMLGRALLGVAIGGFWSMSTAIVMRLVPEELVPKALAILNAGNAIAATKAINAARMAMRGNGTHVVTLDKAIKTMRETGADMKTKYKETSRGGLALNVIEC
jgi:predicted MFS family arabinose efflux permease